MRYTPAASGDFLPCKEPPLLYYWMWRQFTFQTKCSNKLYCPNEAGKSLHPRQAVSLVQEAKALVILHAPGLELVSWDSH